MGMRQALRNSIMDHYFRGASSPRADTYYLGFLVTGGSEVGTANWTSYERRAVDASAASSIFAAAANPTGTRTHSRNSAPFTFEASATVDGSGPELTGVAIWAASSGGDPLITGALATPQTVNNGAPVTIPTNGLTFFLDEADD